MRFWEQVEFTQNRMRNDQRRAAEAALKAGGTVISRGRHYEGGPVVVTVSCPPGWWKVGGQEVKTCSYIEENENA